LRTVSLAPFHMQATSHWHLFLCEHCLTGTFIWINTVSGAPPLVWHAHLDTTTPLLVNEIWTVPIWLVWGNAVIKGFTSKNKPLGKPLSEGVSSTGQVSNRPLASAAAVLKKQKMTRMVTAKLAKEISHVDDIKSGPRWSLMQWAACNCVGLWRWTLWQKGEALNQRNTCIWVQRCPIDQCQNSSFNSAKSSDSPTLLRQRQILITRPKKAVWMDNRKKCCGKSDGVGSIAFNFVSLAWHNGLLSNKFFLSLQLVHPWEPLPMHDKVNTVLEFCASISCQQHVCVHVSSFVLFWEARCQSCLDIHPNGFLLSSSTCSWSSCSWAWCPQRMNAFQTLLHALARNSESCFRQHLKMVSQILVFGRNACRWLFTVANNVCHFIVVAPAFVQMTTFELRCLHCCQLMKTVMSCVCCWLGFSCNPNCTTLAAS